MRKFLNKPNFPVADLHTVVQISLAVLTEEIAADLHSGTILGDDGQPLTTEQIETRLPGEVMVQARQHALEQATAQLLDLASREGHIVEETEPVIDTAPHGHRATFQFRMMVVPADEEGKYPFDSLLRDAFNAGVAEAKRLVTRAHAHMERHEGNPLSAVTAGLLERIAKDIEAIKRK